MSELKTKWPDEADYISIEPPDGHEAGHEDYERARADAAIERLRVAVAALIQIGGNWPEDPRAVAEEALAVIGPIPGDGE